jgi:hypothetical protein
VPRSVVAKLPAKPVYLHRAVEAAACLWLRWPSALTVERPRGEWTAVRRRWSSTLLLFLQPNVGAEPTVEAGSVSPGCDDAPWAAAWAYAACRSGSARVTG